LLAAKNPAKIFFSGRNKTKADELITSVKHSSSSTELIFIECDLSSLASVQQAAKQFLAQSSRLDVLMCNAGVMALPPGLSKDGYEIQFATNHLGHALLTADVRIVNLSSTAHATTPKGGIEFSTLKTPQESLGPIYQPRKFTRYGQSKLANLLYTTELAKRYPAITSIAVHPGFVKTNMTTRTSFLNRQVVAMAKLASLASGGKSLSFEEGPYNQTWAATTPKENVKTGAYYEPIGTLVVPTTNFGNASSLAERLYDWTEKELTEFE
jgi:NAD(P)-dependent dehydrogenase (short-subunit alcohol dehydrogenase family)